MMKKIFPVLLMAAVLMTACQKEDAKKDYGFAKVYIPQATVTGIDNSYPIPLGPFYQNSKYTCSYDAASGKLDIVLGVIRSGYFAQNPGYSVSLGKYTPDAPEGVELPADVYSFPSGIVVPDGETGATVKVSVDLKALSAKRASFYAAGVYQILYLGLEISNLQGPGSYSLADANTSVVIKLDMGSEHWDSVPAEKPEAGVRALFPFD